MPAGLIPDSNFLIVPSVPSGIHCLKNNEQALPVFGIQDLLQFTNLFPQLPDLLDRFLLAHSGRLIGVYF